MEIKINLLPDYRKEEIAKANRFKLVIRLGLVILSIFILFYSFLFGLISVLKTELNSVLISQKMSGNTEQLSRIKNFDDEFKETNSMAGQSLTLEKDQLYWTNLFTLLSNDLSDGITITNLATKDYSVLLAGKANDRDALMKYKDKLAGEKCFSNVNLPLSNLVSKEDISFQMDLKIDKDCLRLYAE
ncbi:MAG: PilN domain-containing protein [Parcubacteria group bacterium]|jgi:Tfp pilus assembly protein PilN